MSSTKPHRAFVTILVLCGTLLAARAAQAGDVGAVHPCPGYDFAGSITNLKIEFSSLDEFFKLYAPAIADDGHRAVSPAAAAGTAGPARPASPYGQALANLTVGLLKDDQADISRAKALFAADGAAVADQKEKALARLGAKYVDELLSGKYPDGGVDQESVKPVVIRKYDPPKNDFQRIILGRSAITVRPGALVKTQVDRVIRDWQLGWKVTTPPWAYAKADLVPWHEGHKIGELVDLADVRVVPVWGTRARKVAGRWYAPDATGAPRFEIMPDKVDNYPTNIAIDQRTAIINDTHGISALAWDSLDADLVLGCGDYPGKMDAAYYLAERGVNVYMPSDRYIGLLMGARTKGVIIGSGPIRKAAGATGAGAIIGGQAVALDVAEPIVVSNTQAGYPLRYYDTPYTYFKALEAYAGKPLNIVPVEVKVYGHAEVVVEQARKLAAKLIGIRVKSKFEHDAVAAWLKEDPARRAVLFHTALYPDGYKLFFEFPKQTGFGDIAPQFE